MWNLTWMMNSKKIGKLRINAASLRLASGEWKQNAQTERPGGESGRSLQIGRRAPSHARARLDRDQQGKTTTPIRRRPRSACLVTAKFGFGDHGGKENYKKKWQNSPRWWIITIIYDFQKEAISSMETFIAYLSSVVCDCFRLASKEATFSQDPKTCHSTRGQKPQQLAPGKKPPEQV